MTPWPEKLALAAKAFGRKLLPPILSLCFPTSCVSSGAGKFPPSKDFLRQFIHPSVNPSILVSFHLLL